MMRALPAVLFLLLVSGVEASEEARFMSYPDILGDKILFSYDGDLWTAGLRGGLPYRLTSHPGGEIMGKYSPDRRWIAFTGNYHGTPDVYVMPAEGGTPKRLSWFPAPALMVNWTPDSRHVVLRSPYGRIPVARDMKLYRVSVEGGMPEPLPLDRGVSCSFSEEGKRMLYTRKGSEDYYWKRCKGGQYTDIFTGLLGADLAADTGSGLHRFQRIYGPTRYFTGIEMPLSRPDIDVKAGDYLLAIDGKPVRVPDN